ncbi:hypothetical protein ACS0TY_021803 [Phlomoides rotata]
MHEEPNVGVNQFHPQIEDVNYIGRQNGQGCGVGNYGLGRQYHPQSQSYNQGQFHQGQWKFQNSSQPFQDGGASSYNPNVRKHDNFSYGNPNGVVQFLLGFDPRAKLPTHEGKLSIDEILALILTRTEGYDKMEETVKIMGQQFKKLEFQVGQLASIVGNMQNKGQHDKEEILEEIIEEDEEEK